MKYRSAVFAAASVLFAVAGSAMAAGPVTAKLQTPVQASRKVVAGGAIFNCQADTCTASSEASSTLTVMGCRELVREVGAISAYGGETRKFEAEKLAACNASAKTK